MINLLFGLGGIEIFILSLVILGMLIPIYFIIKILLSSHMTTNKKILWILAIFILSIIGVAVFYYSDDYDDL